MIKDKNILIVGAGNAGRPAANLMNFLGNHVKVSDINTFDSLPRKAKKKINTLEDEGIEFELGFHNLELLDWADIAFISPNIPEKIEFIQKIYEKVENNEIELIDTSDIGVILNKLINIPMIGISGTDGKTTTTNMVNFSLKDSYNTLIFSSIQNSLVIEGLIELVVNKQTEDKDFAVFELPHGTIRMVEGLELASGIVTNLTPDHLDEFDGFEEYVKRNFAIKDLIKEEGVLILNGDDPLVARESLKLDQTKILYGVGNPQKVTCEGVEYYQPVDLDVIAENIQLKGLKGSQYTLKINKIPTAVCDSCGQIECTCGNFQRRYIGPFEREVEIKVPGSFNVENSMATIISSLVLGFDIDSVIDRIATFGGVKGRFEKISKVNDIEVIMDASHNPESMEKLFRGWDLDGRLIVSVDNPDTLTTRDKFKVGTTLGEAVDVVIVSAKNETTGVIDQSAADEVLEGAANIEAYSTNSVLESIIKAFSIAAPGDTILHIGPGVVNAYQSVKDDIFEAVSFYDALQDNVVVIGGCGTVGSLMARVLKSKGCNVTISDMAEDTYLRPVFEKEDITLALGDKSEEILSKTNTVFIAPSLINNPNIKNLLKKYSIRNVLTVHDILKYFKADKPVIGITGTNGKTTTTHMLKNIFKIAGLEVPEHYLKIQGNTDFIPALQSRLTGDLAVVEIGTFGNLNEIKLSALNSNVSMGIITNISKDHLSDGGFNQYMQCKKEMVDVAENLILNADDPLVNFISTSKNHDNLLCFGIDDETTDFEIFSETIRCPSCGEVLKYNTHYLGNSGDYYCDCGFERPELDIKASNIQGNSFDLIIYKESRRVTLSKSGIFNIYNALGAASIAWLAGVEFDDIVNGLETFNGVNGRFEQISNEPEIILDFAHNPAGVRSLLQTIQLNKDNDSKVIVVDSISSESGIDGDLEIVKLLSVVDIIIPVSQSSANACELVDEMDNNKVINISGTDFVKDGTLGANSIQVEKGIDEALNIANDNDIILIIGEGGVKFSKDILTKKNII